jgi:hypothetical protein
VPQFYVRRIGDVKEVTVKGGTERLKLVKFHKGGPRSTGARRARGYPMTVEVVEA